MHRRLLLFAALLLWCGALLAARMTYSHTHTYAFLVWNLFLAMIPAVAAIAFVRTRGAFARAMWFALWLLFLPNAPYIATDFVHLRALPNVPLWFDVAMLLSCAATGILLGFTSLADVQGVVARRFGRPAAWVFALSVLILCGFGIYVGRFLRWNSWDVVTSPARHSEYLLASAAHPAAHPRTFGVTAIYGVGLAVGYVAFRVAATEMQ